MSNFNKYSIGTLLAASLVLTGCETTNPNEDITVKTPFSSLNAHKKIPLTIQAVLALLKEEKYNEASSLINQNLQSEPRNVTLHLLNSLIYEKLAEMGNAAGNELAAIGYQNAINLDPTNAFAITQLGKIRYREQNYDQAQEHFANALLVKPSDPDLWQELAAASYYNYDLKTALTAIDRAEKLKPNDPLIHRSAAMIYSALGDFKTAKKHLDFFVEKAGDDPAVDQVKTRYNDWNSLYKSGRVMLTAGQQILPLKQPSSGNSQSSSTAGSSSGGGSSTSSSSTSSGGSSGGGSGEGSSDSSASSPSSGGPYDIDTESKASEALSSPIGDTDGATASTSPPVETKGNSSPQIIVDCYILRISEDAITSKGNNILENLAVTLNPGSFVRFKGSLWGSGVPPLSSNSDTTTNLAFTEDQGFKPNQVPDTNTANSSFSPQNKTYNIGNKGSFSGQIFTAGLTWAGLTYSLNIANATDNRTEVVSRPSLMTFLNKSSIFFSGNELVNGFTGQYGGTLVKYPVGVTLDVTPTSLEGDVLTLQVGLEGSILTAPNPNLAETVNVGKTRVDTFVKLHLGETLMLGGIYERLEVSSKSGFPGLQDIPVAQYFFSNETTASSRKSVVFMLTPRSPDIVKTAVNRAMAREAVTPHLRELIARTPDWFHTHINLIPIFRYLATDPVVYYEFRSADILPPSWGWEPPVKHKVEQILHFLYY